VEGTCGDGFLNTECAWSGVEELRRAVADDAGQLLFHLLREFGISVITP